MSQKRKAGAEPAAYKTEEQLKVEARERARQQELLAAKRKPKSSAETKVENYWYHYKWLTIGGAFALVLLVLLLKDLLFKVNPDYTIVVCSERYLSEEVLDDMVDQLLPYAQDRNGDGKIKIEYDNIMLPATALMEQYALEEGEMAPPEEEDLDDPAAQAEAAMSNMAGADSYAIVMKLMAVVAANSDPIYLMDQPLYDYLLRANDDEAAAYDFFQLLDGEIPAADRNRLPVEHTAAGEGAYADQLAGMAFYYRSNNSSNEKTAGYWQDCYQLLQDIAG